MNRRVISSIILLIVTSLSVYLYYTSHRTSYTNTSTYPSSLDLPTPTLPAGSCQAQNGLPDSNCTPGLADPRVTQDNIGQTICVKGYTKTVRPPVSYTDPLKAQLMQKYGDTDSPRNYELDHLIPLEVGGNPSDVKNLWPEPGFGQYNYHQKDGLENYLHAQVCSGAITLSEAQREISTNWVQYWLQYGQP